VRDVDRRESLLEKPVLTHRKERWEGEGEKTQKGRKKVNQLGGGQGTEALPKKGKQRKNEPLPLKKLFFFGERG